MKKSDVERLCNALGSNLNMLDIFFGDDVHGQNARVPYAIAKEIYFLLKSMKTSNSIIWEDEDNQNDIKR